MNITIIGGGSFGTSMAQQLAVNNKNNINLLFKNKSDADLFNKSRINKAYFPNRQLRDNICGTYDYESVKSAEVIFIAVPAKNVKEVTQSLKPYLQKDTLIINLTKGLYEKGKTVVEFIQEQLSHKNIATLKGPSFAIEMLNREATLMTLGFSERHQLQFVKELVSDTSIYLDYTEDIRGVEVLSALKNIYAILLGSVDAKYNSANTRFLVLTKAFSEIKLIVKYLGGDPNTINLACGLGDINLTALNDLSRNRTLGLLIGKGFYNKSYEENSVVLEGLKTLKLTQTIVPENLLYRLPLLQQMLAFFMENKKEALQLDFEELFENKYNTVLTYGTFDLLHFGHLEILRRAKELGDELIVGLSTDEFNESKGKKCEFPYEKRKEFLESLSYVDKVIPEDNWEQKVKDVQNYEVDTFVMGHDWEGKFDFLKEYCKVHYFPRTKGISTTQIKEIMNKEK